MLIASQPTLQVAHRDWELVDRQVTARAHCDERPAFANELPERFEAFVADPSAILFTNCFEVEARQNVTWLLIWQDNRVELLAQLSAFDFRVV